MKKLLLICSLIFIASQSDAQTFTASPTDYFESTYDVNDWVSDYVYIINSSGSPISIGYQTLTNTMIPIGWDVLMCTSNGCFPYVPVSGSLGIIENGESGFFNLHAGFLGIPGTGEVSVRVFETGNPSNADTITFVYHATMATSIFENINKTEFVLSQNFPNPFSVSTTVKYKLDSPTGKLIITDIQGKKINEYNLINSTGELIITGNLKSGIYFYSLYNNENKMISRNRMTVQ